MPKSRTRTAPSAAIITFAGLMSRCMTPAACAAASASAISRAIERALYGSSAASAAITSATVLPRSSSITMKAVPSSSVPAS